MAIVFIAVTFMIISEYPAIAAILSFICLLILTARAGVEIDKNKKTYQEYMTFFYFIKMGKPVKYDSMEYLFISSREVLKRTIFGSSKKDTVHSANIQFKSGDTVKLIAERNKEDLKRKAEVIANQLDLEIQ